VPNVSVIIPTYNRVASLKRAVASILNQTYRDFEAVVVNDGSTDRTAEYLATLDIPQIRHREFPVNRGGSAARNEGIKMARGNLIAFLDDDDLWEPAKLREQVNAVAAENADSCYTGVTKLTFHGTVSRYIFRRPKYPDLYKSFMADNFVGGTSSFMVKKGLLENIGGFDEALTALQDWDLFIRLSKNGCTMHGINRSLVSYRVADNSRNISGSFTRFNAAAEHLRKKYRDAEFFPLLKKRLAVIELKRYVKSRYFLLDAIKYYSKRLANR
jgi:glycosyltransferase involved in cell wall biosynthesis